MNKYKFFDIESGEIVKECECENDYDAMIIATEQGLHMVRD